MGEEYSRDASQYDAGLLDADILTVMETISQTHNFAPAYVNGTAA